MESPIRVISGVASKRKNVYIKRMGKFKNKILVPQQKHWLELKCLIVEKKYKNMFLSL